MKHFYAAACLATILGACAAEDSNNSDEANLGADDAIKPTIEVADNNDKSGEVDLTWECNVASNNGGCFGDIVCPDNKFVKAVRAGCNLESNNNPPSWDQAWNLPTNLVQVFKRSDIQSQGICKVGATSLSAQTSTNVGVSGFDRAINVGCREHDQNGGDCLQRGIVTCGW